MTAESIRFELLENKLYYSEEAVKRGMQEASTKNQFRVRISGIGAAGPKVVFLFHIGDFQGCLTTDSYVEAIQAKTEDGTLLEKDYDESGNLQFELAPSAPSRAGSKGSGPESRAGSKGSEPESEAGSKGSKPGPEDESKGRKPGSEACSGPGGQSACSGLGSGAAAGSISARKTAGEASWGYRGLEEEGAITITFYGIEAYPFDGEDMSMTSVEISWSQDGELQREVLRLYLTRGRLAINSFTSDAEHVCVGDTVTLSWSAAGAERCQIGPRGDTAEAVGSGAFPVYEDTEFVFRVFKGDRSECRSILVFADKSVEKVSLAAIPEGLVAFGQEVELRAGFAPARHGFISGGVGRVEQASVKWKPYSRGLPYVLSCVGGATAAGADVKQASVMTGMENAVQVRSMSMTPLGENRCYLYWNVYCADAVDIWINGKSAALSKPPAGDLTFSCEQIAGTVVTLVCRGASGQVLTRSIRMA